MEADLYNALKNLRLATHPRSNWSPELRQVAEASADAALARYEQQQDMPLYARYGGDHGEARTHAVPMGVEQAEREADAA